MDKRFVKLSKKVYEASSLKIEKYQERPFAYEFYHQLRKLLDEGQVDFGGYFVQPEVNKEYQHYFEQGKIPDFIIHIPNTNKNLAVIEFKLATSSRIENDLQKLVEFKKPELKYDYAIEVIIGNGISLERARKTIEKLSKRIGEEIIIIWFNTDSWRTKESIIKY